MLRIYQWELEMYKRGQIPKPKLNGLCIVRDIQLTEENEEDFKVVNQLIEQIENSDEKL